MNVRWTECVCAQCQMIYDICLFGISSILQHTMMHCQLKFIGHFSWSVEISRKRISWRRRRRRCIRIMVFKFKRMMENKWDSSDFHCLQIAKKNWIAFHSFLNFKFFNIRFCVYLDANLSTISISAKNNISLYFCQSLPIFNPKNNWSENCFMDIGYSIIIS